MRTTSLISIPTLIFLLLLSCQKEELVTTKPSLELTPEITGQCIEKGNAASEALMGSLSTQLKAAMSNGGPIAAVGVCQQVAQPSTDAISSSFGGLEVSRTSLKVRNPENAPDDLDRAMLESWQRLVEEDKPLPDHKLHPVDDTTVRFYKPIVTQELCVKCHGPSDSLDPELISLLDELYPEDKARGYEAGELRGAFRVEIDLNSLKNTDPED